MKEAEDMVVRLRDFAEENGWLSGGERVLLAVSGGLDSVAMVDLFRRAGFAFGVAHCNFQLRGAESEGDAQLVRELAGSHGVPYYETSFPTGRIARERKMSIQVLARELRYQWFEEIRSKEGFHWIATAHHLNDAFETALYNWTKGTGLRGLLGIPRQNGKVIRPLLFTTRSELETYVAERSLNYRLDISNLEDKYSRNKIRRHVWPVLKQINPGLEDTFRDNLERLSEIQQIYDWALTRLRAEWIETRGDELYIPIVPLRAFPAARTLLFAWLHPYGFSSRQTEQVHSVLGHEPGAMFYSPSHRILLDRDWLIVAQLKEEEKKDVLPVLPESQTIRLPEGMLEIQLQAGRPASFFSSSSAACLDADRLVFPLQLRRWREGDRFAPLGMGGQTQKLQDFFSNQKLSRFDKERVWLLVSGDGEIAWVVGRRIGESFKITDLTKNYLQLRFEKM